MLPLGRIYQYVHRTRDTLLDDNTLAYKDALARSDLDAAAKLNAQITCLEQANIWQTATVRLGPT